MVLKASQLELARVRHRVDELTDEMAKACQDREKALRNPTTASRLQSMQAEIDAAIEAKQIVFETLQTLKLKRDNQMKVYKTAHNGRQVCRICWRSKRVYMTKNNSTGNRNSSMTFLLRDGSELSRYYIDFSLRPRQSIAGFFSAILFWRALRIAYWA